MKLGYRPEIDGMRAIAVSAVILYHLKIPYGDGTLLAGGYLGVDLFFVLSGYLITKIMLIEFDEADRFDVVQFYWRRARRILPPLLLVMLATIPVAWAILLPTEMERFAKSLFAALGFYSNFFWFFELTDYGAQSGLLQPFLHTWSLAIEEQFYLFFPVLLIVLMKWARKALLPVIVALTIAGLVIAQLTTSWHAELSFFSITSRAWELLAGAVLALLPDARRQAIGSWALARIMPMVGVAMIAVSLVVVDLSRGLHPGIASIPTVLGTCLVILFAAPGEPVTRLLSARPAVFVGKLSYSLYLWHFPVYAFGRMLSPGAPGAMEMTAWFALSLLLSIAGYKLVEQPMRHHMALRPFLQVMGVAVLAVIAAPLVLKSLDMRSAPNAQAMAAIYGDIEYDNEVLKEDSWGLLKSLDDEDLATERRGSTATRHEMRDLWFTDDSARAILIVGNSHSKDMYNALALNADRFPGAQFARFAMGNPFPASEVDALVASPNYRAADLVVLAPRWHDNERRLVALVDRIRRDGKQVTLVDNTAEFDAPDFRPLFDYQAQRFGALPDPARMNRLAYDFRASKPRETNAWLAEIGARLGVPVLSRYDLVCSGEERACTLALPDGDKALYDYGHWTLAGARHFGAIAADRGWFGASPGGR